MLHKDKQLFLKGVKRLRTDRDALMEKVEKLKQTEIVLNNLVR